MNQSETITPTLLNRAEFLEQGDYALVVADDKDTDFIINLAIQEQYCRLSEFELRENYYKNAYAVWLALYKEQLVGVVMICKFFVQELNQDIYSLDAYKEQSDIRSFSYKFGQLVCDWIDKNKIMPMVTAHDIKNRAATILALKVGFKKFAEMNGKVVMRRGKWA